MRGVGTQMSQYGSIYDSGTALCRTTQATAAQFSKCQIGTGDLVRKLIDQAFFARL